MASWVLTAGLTNLRDQVNDAFPNRSKASDGTIGDTAHQAEMSGHNPDDTSGSKAEWNGDPDSTPEVRAWDCTSDFGDGVSAQAVVNHLRSLPGISSVIRYMIYNRKIYEAANGWDAEGYDGPSAHTEHIHFSGAWSQAADNNTTFNFRLEEIPVALNSDDRTWIANAIKANNDDVWGIKGDVNIGNIQGTGQPSPQTMLNVTRYGSYEHHQILDRLGDVAAAQTTLSAQLTQLITLLTPKA